MRPGGPLGLRERVAPALRFGFAAALALTGTSRRARARLDGSAAAVLMYHRVLPESEARRLFVEPGMYVTPATFARHLDWLMREFEVLPLGEIVDRIAAGEPLPRGACALSFDDGWRDNLIHALPVLVERRLPATVFVVSDRVGTEGAFWPDELARRLASVPEPERVAIFRRAGLELAGASLSALLDRMKRMNEADREGVLEVIRRETRDPIGAERELLDWSELDRLADGGVAIESHAASHAILTGVPRASLRSELERSLAALRARGHARGALLAYPSGAFDAAVVAEARAAGYRAGFTTQVGLASGGSDPLLQPRVAVHEDISRTRVEFLRFVPGKARSAADTRR